jgi:hypothetical protein
LVPKVELLVAMLVLQAWLGSTALAKRVLGLVLVVLALVWILVQVSARMSHFSTFRSYCW